MTIEREYIKFLLDEIDRNVSSDELTQLKKENNILKQNLKDTEKKYLDVKTKMKKPVTISNPTTISIFDEIKNGGVVRFIQPVTNKRWTTLKSNPFVVEIENKGAIYNNQELIGMYEYKNSNTYYYFINKAGKLLSSEIIFQILEINHENQRCIIRTKNQARGTNSKNIKNDKILKLNPISRDGKYVSSRDVKFIYTKNDGSKFVILENGVEEVI